MTTKPVTVEVSPDILLCSGYSPTRLLEEERATVESIRKQHAAAVAELLARVEAAESNLRLERTCREDDARALRKLTEDLTAERTKREEAERERDAAVAVADQQREQAKTAERERDVMRPVVEAATELNTAWDEPYSSGKSARFRVAALRLADAISALPKNADPVASWPLCASCGKSAREGNHATDLGEGHEYVPAETGRVVPRYPTDSAPAAVASAESESGPCKGGAAAVGVESDDELTADKLALMQDLNAWQGAEIMRLRKASEAAESARDAAIKRAEELRHQAAIVQDDALIAAHARIAELEAREAPVLAFERGFIEGWKRREDYPWRAGMDPVPPPYFVPAPKP